MLVTSILTFVWLFEVHLWHLINSTYIHTYFSGEHVLTDFHWVSSSAYSREKPLEISDTNRSRLVKTCFFICVCLVWLHISANCDVVWTRQSTCSCSRENCDSRWLELLIGCRAGHQETASTARVWSRGETVLYFRCIQIWCWGEAVLHFVHMHIAHRPLVK